MLIVFQDITNKINNFDTQPLDEQFDWKEYEQELTEALIEIILLNMIGEGHEVISWKDAKGHPHIKVVLKKHSNKNADTQETTASSQSTKECTTTFN